MKNFKVFSDSTQLAQAAAQMVIESAACAVAEKGNFHLVLSGGSTPGEVYSLLSQEPYRSSIDWKHVHLWWGDERCVAPEHPESNYRKANELLIRYLDIQKDQIHRIPAELAPADAANLYQQEMQMCFSGSAFPKFDLILLGIGEDGHTASLFPGTKALLENKRWAVENYVEKMHIWRITLTYPAINAASKVVVLVSGTSKAKIIQRIFDHSARSKKYPIQSVNPSQGKMQWLCDESAASLLTSYSS